MEATIEIETGNVKGVLSQRALSLIQEWRKQHIHELMEDWHLSETDKRLKRIEPLE